MHASGSPSQLLLNAQKELQKRRLLAGVDYRPPRQTVPDSPSAGWLSQLLKERPSAEAQGAVPTERDEQKRPIVPVSEARVAPTLAAFCLNHENRHNGGALDAPYRLYKILQLLDSDGRGWLSQEEVQITLTCKGSASYIYGKRQLKIILHRGEGLFWERVKHDGRVRIRLVSRIKLVDTLACGRLQGREVTFPAKLLLGCGRGRQAQVNAALYAAVHAGQIQGQKTEPRPITRATVEKISGCSRYRQRSYEARAGIVAGHNIQIIGRHSDYRLERARIHEHLPAYKHTDYLGKINRHERGADYIAVRLANSYHTPETFTVVHSQRQATINRHLGGLCHMGSEGIDRQEIVRLYHENAAAAVSAYNRDPQTAAFWSLCGTGGSRIWRRVG